MSYLPTTYRRVLLWFVAGLVVAVAGCTARPAASAPPAVAAASSAAPSPVPTELPRPAKGADAATRGRWVTQEAGKALQKQTAALAAGNFGVFAASALPGSPAATRDLRRRFDNLRALQATQVTQEARTATPIDAKAGTWRVLTAISLCYVEPGCSADKAMFDTRWKETADGIRLLGYGLHQGDHDFWDNSTQPYVRPWQTTDLAVRIGRRTLVAVPLPLRSRLPELSRRAEAAAKVADQFAIGGQPVQRYRLYVADRTGWRTWYEGFPGAWVGGVAKVTAPNNVEVAALASDLTPDYADFLLRHELSHASALRGSMTYGDDAWFLIEGLAEYVGQQGSASRYPTADLHAFLRHHKLSSVAAVREPAASASDVEANGDYAVGYFSVAYLMKKYGKAKTLKFFTGAVGNGLGLSWAATDAFGKPWAQVDKDCLAAVRKA